MRSSYIFYTIVTETGLLIYNETAFPLAGPFKTRDDAEAAGDEVIWQTNSSVAACGIKTVPVNRSRDGKDTISDFNADDMNTAEHDYIVADFADVIVSATGTGGLDTLIDFGGGSTITLLGVLSTTVDENDFYTAP